MPLLAAVLAPDVFEALPDETVLGKDSFVKNEKENVYKLALSGDEAAKLAQPLQEKITKLEANNQKLLDEKIKTQAKVAAYEKLGKTPEEIDGILKAGKTETVEELEKKYQAKEESLKTATEQAVNAMKAEMEQAQTKTGEVEKQLQTHVKRTLVAELKNKFDMTDLADDYLSNRLDVEQDDNGQYVTRVKVNGEIAYKAGAPMTPEQLAEEAKQNRNLSGMFNAGQGGGSGGQNNQSTSLRGATVLANDQAGLSMNLEEIASGKIKVTDAFR